MIVTELAPRGTTIREVSFRRGLNVIRTAERTAADTRTVGHSVGKTLLVRLLRYCLGEKTYGTAKQRAGVSSAYESSWVIGVIHVAGQPWCVARPIAQDNDAEYSASGIDVNAVRVEGHHRQPYGAFVETLEAATAGGFNSLTLPHTHPPRRGRWLDLLAWVARDQNCRYRHHHEWRDPDSESGTGQLKLEGAGFLIRMVMGLFATGEEDVIRRHRRLLDELTALQQERDQLKQFHDVRMRELGREFAVDAMTAEVNLFTRSAAERATARRSQFKGLLDDVRSARAADKAWDDLQAAQQVWSQRQRSFEKADARRDAKQLELDSKRADATRSASDDLESLARKFCWFFDTREQAFAEGCPGPRILAQQPPMEEPSVFLTVEISQLEHELHSLADESRERAAAAELARNAVTRAAEEYRSVSAAEQKHIANLSIRIGRQGELRRLALRTQKSWVRYNDFESKIALADKKISESREGQGLARSLLERDRVRLSDIFDFALKRLVGPEAAGAIALDAKGAQPVPTDAVPTGGEAITTSATVLCFDLACMLASSCGLGHFPRLLIHDSPREADMEPQMYHSLFTFLVEAESWFEGRLPNFQYIVTTTTPPPTEVDCPPYVREELHGRDDTGLLFKKRIV